MPPKPRHSSLRLSNQRSASRPNTGWMRRRISRVASSRRDTGDAPGPSGSMVKRSLLGSASENEGSYGTAPGVSALWAYETSSSGR